MSNIKRDLLTWVEVDQSAINHNIKVFRKLVGSKVLLAPSVKANAYGHDLIETSKIALKSGADWLCVNALFEARKLHAAGIKSPLYIMGYVLKKDLAEAVKLGCRLVVYNRETIKALADAAKRLRKKAFIHIKVETGNNRQGILMDELENFARFVKKFPQIVMEGIVTHFANIEDATDSSYARFQLQNFLAAFEGLKKIGVKIPIRHCANSAATILFPETHFDLVRPGIAVYGMWPSEEVKKAAQKKHRFISLKPVLSWKTKIAQIKKIPKGAFVGYGCTYKTLRRTRLAILPVGYYDGYDRGLSNKAHVLIHGKRAPVRGRVCMNIIMADVTDIPRARVEDTAVLLGKDGRAEITAEQMADWADTINYEITTRIHEGISRIITS